MPEVVVRDQAATPRRLNDRGAQARLGVLIWLVPFLVITVLVALNPAHRNVTPLYHHASADWWAHKDLYAGPGGMNYLPVFPVMFAPFHALPVPAGDILWRLCTTVLLATGILRFQRGQFGPDIGRAFLCASILAMPLCLGALRNGQANGMFAVLTLHAAACLPRRRWWPAAALIVLAVAVKPLGAVLFLLSVAIYAPLRLRLVFALAAIALFPFLFAPADYVIAQHRAFFANMQACAVVTQHRFADIGGVIRTFGWELPGGISKLVRVAAGGIALALWWAWAGRLKEPFRAMWLLALTACYLMLFNPMNESNSYVILAPALGLWAAAAMAAPQTRRFAWLTAFISLSMGLLPNLLRPIFGNYFALFWHPVMTTVFIVMLACWIRRPDSPFSGAPGMQ
jgi:hypothetical protein